MQLNNKILFSIVSFLIYLSISIYVLKTGHLHEDAYILYIFSESLANGNGIAYYPGGPHAEGATDFLWMLILGIANYFGVNTAIAASILNGLGVSLITYIALSLFEDGSRKESTTSILSKLLLTLIVVFSPISIASLSGFSPAFYCSFIAVVFYILYTGRQYLAFVPLLSITLGLIRPDGVIIGIVASLIGLYLSYRDRQFLKAYLINSVIAVIIGLCYFIWRYNYFGNLLPLPLYVKGTSVSSLPGLLPHIGWALYNGFLGLLCFYLLITSNNRSRLILASTPIIILFIALLFATQSQNVSYRFQAPGTLILIFGTAILLKTTLLNETKQKLVIYPITIIISCALISYTYKTWEMVTKVLQNHQYINYFPFYLDKEVDNNTVIALTEAGRFAYWMHGKKHDLVGLNTTETAIHKVSPDYLKDINPDLIFIHTAGQLQMSNLCDSNYCSISKVDLQNSLVGEKNWNNVSYGVTRAPLAVHNFIMDSNEEYKLYIVNYGGTYSHFYALRLGGKVKPINFEDALNKSFDYNYHLPYLTMTKINESVFDR